MYPYPSGDLHIGHWYIKTPTDAIARFQRMHGYNVFFPIGFDAFGLPAENAAIKNGIHPRNWTMQNIENMRRQLRTMGATFDWDAEVVTCRPGVLQVEPVVLPAVPGGGPGLPRDVAGRLVPQRRHAGARAGRGRRPALLALRRAGREARPGAVVPADTKYADELLDFAGIDWPEPIRIQQTNWIGRSEGAEIVFETARRRAPAGRRRDPRLHDAARTRCSARRSWSWRRSIRWSTQLTAPGAARRGRGLRRRRPAARPRSSGCRPTARRPASRSAPTRSTRSTASASRSSSPTTCWPATAPARSWPCPPTTSATSRSRSSSGCRSGGSSPPPGRRRRRRRSTTAYIAHADDELLVNSGRFDGLPADEGGERDRRVAGERGHGQAHGHLPPARLADQPPALLGHADPDHLLPDRRHRAGARRRTCRCCCPRPSTTSGSGENPLDHDAAFLNVDLPDVRRPGPARDRHDGHVHRLVVVLVPLPVAATTTTARSTATMVDALDARSTSTPAAPSTP